MGSLGRASAMRAQAYGRMTRAERPTTAAPRLDHRCLRHRRRAGGLRGAADRRLPRSGRDHVARRRSAPPSRWRCSETRRRLRARRRRQGRRRRSRRHPRRAGHRHASAAARRARASTFRAGEGVGTVTRPGLPLPPGEPAINPVPRAMIARDRRSRAATAAPAMSWSRSRSRRRGDRGAHPQRRGSASSAACRSSAPPASSCPIPARPGSTDPSRHRRRPRAGLPHVAGATGSHLGGGGAGAARPAGDGADRHGRFRRRHAEISARAIRSPRVTIAGGVAKMTKLAQGLLDLHSRRGAVDLGCARRARAGGAAALARRIAARQHRRRRPSTSRGRAGSTSACGSRERRAGDRGAACSARGAKRLEIVVFDRDGALAGRRTALRAAFIVSPPRNRRTIVGDRRARCRESPARPAPGRPGSARSARSALRATAPRSSPSVPRRTRSSGQDARVRRRRPDNRRRRTASSSATTRSSAWIDRWIASVAPVAANAASVSRRRHRRGAAARCGSAPRVARLPAGSARGRARPRRRRRPARRA